MKESTEVELATETVDECPLCGGTESIFMFWNYDRLYRLPGKFGTLRCAECGLVRLSPRPTVASIGRHYPEDYGAYIVPPVSANNANSQHSLSGLRDAVRNSILWKMGYDTPPISDWQKLFSPLLTRLFFKEATYGYKHLFPNYVPGGTALEVGCGNGTYLSYLKFHGWKVAGVDLSSFAAQMAKDSFDIDVFVGQLEESPFEDETFDYIHLSHVVEHFFNPVMTMQKIYRLLKPGGIVYIEVPNAEGIGVEESKELWYGWDAPRHLFMFTPATLTKTLTAANLTLVKMKTRLWDALAWANTYAREEKSGEKLSERPSVAPEDVSKVKRQRLMSQIKYRLKPSSGDFICCWAKKAKE